MSKQRHKWEEKIKVIRGKINSLPGHAVLCSATVCYLTRVPSDKHNDLLSAWLGYCNGSVSLGHLSETRGGVQSTQQVLSSLYAVLPIIITYVLCICRGIKFMQDSNKLCVYKRISQLQPIFLKKLNGLFGSQRTYFPIKPS